MVKTVFILNGPNLNALGRREPGMYGSRTLDEIEAECRERGADFGFEIDFRQTNHEGVLVDWLHEADQAAVGVAINPAAYSHTSIALHDAVRAIGVPVVELHLSNIHAREAFRHTSTVSSVAAGVICGFGPASYLLAIEAIAGLLEAKHSS